MANDGRPGCLRPFLGSVLGSLSAVAAVVVIGIIDAPEVNPQDPLEHEWYTPFVLFFLPVYCVLPGAALGALAGAAPGVSGIRLATWAYGGALVGLALGALVLPHDGEARSLLLHAALVGLFAFGGISCVTARPSQGRGRPGEPTIREADTHGRRSF